MRRSKRGKRWIPSHHDVVAAITTGRSHNAEKKRTQRPERHVAPKVGEIGSGSKPALSALRAPPGSPPPGTRAGARETGREPSGATPVRQCRGKVAPPQGHSGDHG